jgi:murein DD-endopeptidase MepM/ murein hydrolase activator NlpD
MLAGSAAASAQTPQDRTSSDVPTLQKEVPAPVATSAPQLQPVAPSPSVVVDASRVVPTEARVVPPPPRIVKGDAGTVVVSSRPAVGAGYESAGASATTPLQVNSSFGYRWGRKHTGIDFQASWGESVGVSMAGTVAFAGMKHGYGNLVIVDHGEGISTYYAHLSSIYVGVGQAVTAREVIGAIGTTGRSTGPHLHYEVRIDGKPINPNSVISSVDGKYFVNGQPFGDEAEPASAAPAGEPTSSLSIPAIEQSSRPRRVVQTNGIEGHVLLYGQNSLTAN